MASPAQVEFFKKLQGEKQFPAGSPDPATLLTQFEAQSIESASEWIEKARALPKPAASEGDATPPPF